MISIIIPVYNGEKTIKRCLDSILNNIEMGRIGQIIIVDDGSTDSTYKVCLDYKEKYKKIDLIHQNNKGVSEARQNGILRATEEWIVFVDADDEVITDFTYDILYNEKADWIIFSKTFMGLNKDISKNEMFLAILGKSDSFINKVHFNTVWSKAYRRDIIKKNCICFSNEIHHGEDVIFNLDYLMHCEKVMCIDKSFYRLHTTEGSATHKFQKMAIDNEFAFNRELNRLNLYSVIENYNIIRYNIALDGLWICIGQYISHPDFQGGIRQRVKSLREFCSISPYIDAIKMAPQLNLKKKYSFLANLLKRKHYLLVCLVFRLKCHDRCVEDGYVDI